MRFPYLPILSSLTLFPYSCFWGNRKGRFSQTHLQGRMSKSAGERPVVRPDVPPPAQPPAPGADPAAAVAAPPLAGLDEVKGMLQVLLGRVGAIETAVAAQREALRPASVGDLVPDADLLNPRLWRISAISTALQQHVLCERLTDYLGEHMYVSDGKTSSRERSRDFYELQSLMDILKSSLPTDVARAAGRPLLQEADADTISKMLIRALLLKEKAEKGVTDMKFLERRLKEREVPTELVEPLKELRARQQQSALFRSAQVGQHKSGGGQQ
jgi:hypothetical protein